MKKYIYVITMLTALLFEFPSFGQNQSIYLKFERDDMTIPSKQDATIFAHQLLSINMVEDISGLKYLRIYQIMLYIQVVPIEYN